MILKFINRKLRAVANILYSLYDNMLAKYYKSHDLRKYADFLYKRHFGRSINWVHPCEMNEKIRWLQFNTDTSLWTLLADKYKVRKYIEDAGYGDILVPLYGVWKDADEIDFRNLPSKFVIKTNHGSGSVYVVYNKDRTDVEEIRRSLSADLKSIYGKNSAEPHYFGIPPVVIAERLLEQNSTISTSLIDYKLYVVGGNVVCTGVIFDRSLESHRYSSIIYDKDWKRIDLWSGMNEECVDREIPCPINYERMKIIAKDLCAQFPFVRLDFYEVDGKLYFGEFTFTPAAACGGRVLSEVAFKEIGSRIVLP